MTDTSLPAIEVDAPPNTTAEHDRQAAGERHINAMWERTQQVIALSAVATGLGVSAFEIVRQGTMKETAMNLVTATLSLVLGFYFSRTNHQRSGGVGGDSAGTR
jgi:cobalamin synthase